MYGLPLGYTRQEQIFGLPNENAMYRGFRGLPFNSVDVVWVAQRSGNFSSTSIWLRGGYVANSAPTTGANVFVPKGVVLTVNQNYTCNNLRVDGILTTDSIARTITVNGACNITGTLDLSTNNVVHNLVLNGVNNYINPSLFVTGTGSTITYSRNGYQEVLELAYRRLTLNGSDIKALKSDTICSDTTGTAASSSLVIAGSAILDIRGYNLTIQGGYNGGFSGVTNNLINSGGASAILVNLTWGIGGNDNMNIGTSTIEFIGNLIQGGASGGTQLYTASTFYFNTITFVVVGTRTTVFTGSCIIRASATLTISTNATMTIVTSLTGENGSSVFDNRNITNYQVEASPMLTGLLYTNQAVNTFTYNRAGNQDIRVPDDGQYRTLTFAGSGVKTLLGNIVCDIFEISSASLSINYNGFTITVNNELRLTGAGQTIPLTANIIVGINCDIFIQGGQKTLAENITFRNLTISTGGSFVFAGFTCTINNNINFTGNAVSSNFPASTSLIHTGDVYITQANSNLTVILQGNRTCDDLILNAGDNTITFAGFTLTSTTTQYIANLSQSVWGTANQPLTNLTLGGTATPNDKTLQGNVSVPTTYTVTGNAVKVDNGFIFGNP